MGTWLKHLGEHIFDALRVGDRGVTINGISTGTVSVDPPSAGAGLGVEITVTITGVAPGDIVVLTPPAAGITAGFVVGQAVVSAADTVKVRVINGTAGTVDVAAASWTYLWIDLT